MRKVFCKDCKHYYEDKEHSISNEFIYGEDHNSVTTMEGGSGIECCQHKVCFDRGISYDNIVGAYFWRKRIAGPAQLNKKCDCKYFEEMPKFTDKIKNLLKIINELAKNIFKS